MSFGKVECKDDVVGMAHSSLSMFFAEVSEFHCFVVGKTFESEGGLSLFNSPAMYALGIGQILYSLVGYLNTDFS
jgi:hypothetical protein